MKPLLAYITAKNDVEAREITQLLIHKKLASCVLTQCVKSSFRWQGKIENTEEILLIAKTFDVKYQKLEKEVKQVHSYTTPCIVAVPVVKGSKEYLTWSKKECT